METLIPLITNLSTKNREYVLFTGAGLSKDAGIKSGWDILIESLIPLYINEQQIESLPDNYYSKIEEWYLAHPKYSKLGYSEILELLYEGEIERREFLKKFFNDAQPGDAHREIALMVKNKIVRFIFTTNFDDLIEKALDELNVDYDVIFSDDVLQTTKSWDKVQTCRIYKLHGDYKAGKVRNTVSELKQLDPIIGDDFQYIIDRHGIIVIGYSGRNFGIMEHFEKRKPYQYPFYWQYVNHPKDKKSFKLYYKLIDLYKNTHQREIHFIKNESANIFLSNLNSGIANLERVLISADNITENYRDYILNQNDRKIRALSIDLINKFTTTYDEFIKKEDLDNHFSYKYDVFKDFIQDIQFVFKYVKELLEFKLIEETEFIVNRLLKHTTDFNWGIVNEFIRQTTPYYLIMHIGSLFLKYNYFAFINNFYDYRLKVDSMSNILLMNNISFHGEGWEYVAKEIIKKNYFAKRYSTISDFLLSDVISLKEYNYFDAYIAMDLVLKNKNLRWAVGSSIYSDDFISAYNDYIAPQLKTKEQTKEFASRLSKKYDSWDYDHTRGIRMLLRNLDFNNSE